MDTILVAFYNGRRRRIVVCSWQAYSLSLVASDSDRTCCPGLSAETECESNAAEQAEEELDTASSHPVSPQSS